MFKDEGGVLTGRMAAELQAEFGVSTAISPHDMLMNALVWVHKGDVEKAFRAYIEDGRRNAMMIKEAVDRYPPKSRSKNPAVLDFASGYGRVGRHIATVAPDWRYTAMDIHRQAVDFNKATLGLETILSHREPDGVRIEPRFDVIFALSFFSHVRREHFVPWLEALHRMLVPGGVLIFTTHGRVSRAQVMPQVVVGRDGYGMLEESEQHDLSTEYYIHAITYKPFVVKAIRAASGLRLLGFEEKSWWGHQDMYALRNKVPARELSSQRAMAARLRHIQTEVRQTARGALQRIKRVVRGRGSA